MLKGTATIELTNVKTGEREVYTEENMVTNAVNDVLLMDPFGFARAGHTKNSYLTKFPVVPNLIGGIYLCENALEEDPDKYWVPDDNPIVGYANTDVNTTAEPRRGSGNQNEQGWLDDGKGYKFVFDFTTAQGNGTISSLGLTGYYGGEGGLGSEYATYCPILSTHGTDYTLTSGEKNTGFLAAHICAINPTENVAYAVYPKSANKIGFAKVYFPISDVGLADSPSMEFLPISDDAAGEISTSNFGTKWPTSSGSRYCCFVDGEDGYIWGFEHANNIDGNSSSNATVNWIKISTEDWSFEEGTWQIAMQLRQFGNVYYYSTVPDSANNVGTHADQVVTNAIIHNGWLYLCHYNKKSVVMVELRNPANIIEIDLGETELQTNMYTSYGSGKSGAANQTMFNLAGDTVCFYGGHIKGGVFFKAPTGTDYAGSTAWTQYRSTNAGLRGTPHPGLKFGPFLFSTGDYQYSGGSYGSGYVYKVGRQTAVHLVQSYLATINNLSKPVQKTADKTMKITYIIREEE